MSNHFNDALQALRKAGEVILEIYRSDFETETKKDNSPVTAADLAAHDVLVEALAPYGYPIISEEATHNDIPDAEYFWLIDPVDGTGDFVRKSDDFCSMIALIQHDTPVFGAIYAPTTEDLYTAEKGKGAYLHTGNGMTQLHVSETSELDHSHSLVSRVHYEASACRLEHYMGDIKMSPMGSNGLKAAHVAVGNADFFVNPTDKMGEWDVAAPQIIVEEAGGMATGFRGETLTYGKESLRTEYGFMASNGTLHDDLLERFATDV